MASHTSTCLPVNQVQTHQRHHIQHIQHTQTSPQAWASIIRCCAAPTQHGNTTSHHQTTTARGPLNRLAHTKTWSGRGFLPAPELHLDPPKPNTWSNFHAGVSRLCFGSSGWTLLKVNSQTAKTTFGSAEYLVFSREGWDNLQAVANILDVKEKSEKFGHS